MSGLAYRTAGVSVDAALDAFAMCEDRRGAIVRGFRGGDSVEWSLEMRVGEKIVVRLL